jgi:tight adherence protein C
MYMSIFMAGAGAALLAYATLSAAFSDQRVVNRHLKGLSSYELEQATGANPLLAPMSSRVLRPAGAWIASTLGSLTPVGYRAALARRLRSAGDIRGMGVGRFVAIKVAVAFSAGCVLAAVGLMAGAKPVAWMAIAASAVGSFWLPDMWLSGRIDKRRTQIRRALPDMLDMLTISIEAGLGFDQAVARLVKSTSGPLSEELGRALQRMQAGADRSDALRQLGDTCEVEELKTFISAIVQADVLGVSISKVLRTHAKEMRLARRQRAEELAQKAPVKIVFPLVLCILPATIIVIMGPAIVRIGRAFGFFM